MVMNSIEELLTAVTHAADAQEGVVSPTRPVPAATSEPDAAMEEIASASAQLHAAVQRIRAQFLRLADIEIRKAMDLALGSALSFPPSVAPSTPSPAARVAPPIAQAQPETAQEAAPPQTKAKAPTPAPAEVPAGTMEGTVRLLVFANGNMRRVIQFVDELTQRPQFRMLRMAGSPSQQGAVVSVALREPVAFLDVLAGMGMVASVEETSDPSVPGDGPLLTVQLRPV